MSTADLIPPELARRPLLESTVAGELAALFGVLANDTRLRILHTIARDGEVSVSDIAGQVGAGVNTVSNQLQRLADQGFVATRRDGNRIFYRLDDPCVGGLMELGLCLQGHEPGAC